jgi:hypothetical protein
MNSFQQMHGVNRLDRPVALPSPEPILVARVPVAIFFTL